LRWKGETWKKLKGEEEGCKDEPSKKEEEEEESECI